MHNGHQVMGKRFHFYTGRAALLLGMALLVVFLFSAGASAQESGQVSGTVTDVTGAAIPKTNVSVKNLTTNAVRSVTTNASGQYTITGLLPALYELAIDPSGGFTSYKAKIEITVGGRLTQDVKLSVGSATVSVDVAAEGGTQINTQTQELSQVVSSQFVAALPSLTRNPYDFVELSGNISNGDSSGPGGTTATAGQQNNGQARGAGFSINGQRPSGTEILLDGVENINLFTDYIGISVPLDGTQEFRVVTNNFEPQYGRASGGVLNVTTKSGGNAFHGDVWEYNRLSAYTSNTVTNAQQGLPKGTYTRNQFGFAVGGPILKDKLFFFGSTEWIRVRSSAELIGGVPTSQFLALAAPNIQSYFQQYGSGNTFNFVNTVSAATLGITAIPGNTPALGIVSYQAPANAGGGNPQNTYNILGRFDYNLGDKTQIFFRYVNYNEVDGLGSVSNTPYAQYDVGGSVLNTAYLLSAAHEFTPALASITKASFSRLDNPFTYNTALQNTPTLFVISGATIPNSSTGIKLPGFYDTNTGVGGLPSGGPQNVIQVNEDITLTKGKHSFQAGGQILYIQDNNAYGAYAQANEVLGNSLNSGLAALQSGHLFQFSAAVNPNGALPCVRDPYSGQLTQNTACSINLPATAPSFARSDRFHDWAVYAQDSWKATPRTTLNYGVRYEYYGVQHNNNQNLDSNFYYGPGTSLPAQIRSGQVATVPNSPIHGLWKPQYGTVSPRVGFAYDIFGNGKTSIRGGYGISYERNFGNVTFNVIQNPPNYAVIVVNNTALQPLYVTNSNAGPLGAASGNVPLPPTSLRNVDENIRTAQTQFWSAALEQQLAVNTLVSLQYSGARGIHLYDIKNYNGLGSGNALLGDPTQDPAGRINPATGKPYPPALTRLNDQYSNINNRGSGGDSKYEAMNIQFETTNLHHTGLSVIANYTLAHETDDLSSTFSDTAANDTFGLGYTDPFNPSLDYGNGDLDVRHRLVVAPIYSTPSFRNSVSHSTLLNQIFAKWQVSGIYTLRTGTPFTYYDTTNNVSGYGVPRYTPAGGVVPQHTFKSIPKGVTSSNNAYLIGSLPKAYSFGNPALLGASDWGPYPSDMSTRNSFRGPGAWNVDASLSKTFPIHKQFSVELRADAIDLFNHHNLYLQESLFDVANNPSAPSIIASRGGIGSNNGSNGANDERRYGQFSAKINF